MKKLLLVLVSLFLSLSALANPIDNACKSLSYKSAPVVNADQYICHHEYAIAYSWTSRNPIYTTEFLDKSHVGALPRTNDFRVDPAVDSHHQATPRDYSHSGTACGPVTGARSSSCDKGHMTPDQDFSACDICVHESFFLTNMVPQNYKNNEIRWKELEGKIRKYVQLHPKGVYVITGPIYANGKPVTMIGKNQVWVPSHLFKLIIDAETGKSIAFLMPNAEIKDQLINYVTNLSAIEVATGIKFDSSLDKITIANYNDWMGETK